MRPLAWWAAAASGENERARPLVLRSRKSHHIDQPDPVIDLEAFKGSPKGEFVPALRAEHIAMLEGRRRSLRGRFAIEDHSEFHIVEPETDGSPQCVGKPGLMDEPRGVAERSCVDETMAQVRPQPPCFPRQWVGLEAAADPGGLFQGYHAQNA